MAKRRTKRYRKSNARRRRTSHAVARVHRRRTNPRRYRRTHHRRVNSHRRRRVNYRRPNPSAFGMSGSNLGIAVGGILVGVAATKYLPTLVPSSLTASFGSSPIMGVIITAAGAFGASWLAHRFVGNRAFGDAVLMGGLAQTASQILNMIAPPQLSSALALSGMGDIVPGWFAVPQNSVTNRAPVMVAPTSGGPGMGLVARRGLYRR